MRKQITRFSPVQTAKTLAAVYFLFALPLILLMLVPTLLSTAANKPPIALLIGMPFLYGALGFVFTWFFALIYNLIAKNFGGIEYTTIEKTDS